MMSSSLGRALMRSKRLTANPAQQQARCMGDGPKPIKVDIGSREVVGFGINGEENYMDDVHYPFPAIRFQENKGPILVIVLLQQPLLRN